MTKAQASTAFEVQTYRKVDLRLLPFLFVCYILAYLDRVNVGFAKLQMLHDLGLSEAAFATGAGIFFIGYFFFEVPSNVLLKRFGARVWIARIMISWGAISVCTMFVKGAWSFYALRVLLGFAEAGFFPGIIFYLTLWYPSSRRSTRSAWFISAIAVSGVIGNPTSGWIIDSFSGYLHLAGWQWLFLAEGLPSIVVGVLVLSYLDSGISEAKWLSMEEKEFLSAQLNAEDQRKSRHKLRDALTSGVMWVLSAIYFTLMIGLYGISFWLPTAVKAFGVEGYLKIGLVTAIPYLVAVIGMIFLSHHSDRTGERRLHYVFNVTAGATGLILSQIFVDSPWLAIAFLSLATLGVIGSMPLFWPLPSRYLAGTAAAAGIGLVNSIGNLGGFVGPNIAIWLKSITSSKSVPVYVIAGTLLAGAFLIFFFVPKDQHVEPYFEPDAPRA